jgi:RNA polymerase sigma factor (sigma-70 family)
MLGSPEEAEDAVQHTFAAAFNDLQRQGERELALKPWLYTIARNRCVSLLRARREQISELMEVPTEGLHEQVARRTELRELLGDLGELPEEQRAALLLAEAAGLSHSEVAGVLGCEVARVKALVFRARNGLIERREARDTPCTEIREQLANLRGGSLRRSGLRHHIRHCPGCSDYREQVRRQRQLLAVALPVAPSLGFKSSVLSAVGIGGGGAGGAAAAGGAATGGGVLSSLGSAAVAKVAVVSVLAGGGLVAGEAAIERTVGANEAPPPVAAPAGTHHSGEAGGPAQAGSRSQGELRGERRSAERSQGRRGAERRTARSQGLGNAEAKPGAAPEHAADGRKLGQVKRLERQAPARAGGRDRAELLGRGGSRAPASSAPAEQAEPPASDSATIVAPEAAPVPAPKATAPSKLKPAP